MMRNLVWTFWLALILAIIGTFVSSIILVRQWNSFMHYSQLEGRPNYPLQELSKEIEIVLNNNNKGDLETILLDNPIVEFGEVFLINSSGSDVLGRTLPEEILIDQDDRSYANSQYLHKR